MSNADHYLARAAEFHAKAGSERSPGRRSQLETLERDYLRLAAQAELTPTDRAQSGKKTLRLYSMNGFRGILREIAQVQVSQTIAKIDRSRQSKNLSSAIRLFVLDWVRSQKVGVPPAEHHSNL